MYLDEMMREEFFLKNFKMQKQYENEELYHIEWMKVKRAKTRMKMIVLGVDRHWFNIACEKLI